MSRRFVLRGLGVSLSLPLFDAMLPGVFAKDSMFQPMKQSTVAQPRMICCYVPNGVNIKQWVPEQSGTNYQLSPTLTPLASLQEYFSVISGLGHPNSEGGHSGADTWLTGANLKAVPGADYSNTISVDQVVAEVIGKSTRIPSLQLGDQSGTGSAGHSHTLSFDRSGTPLPSESSPKNLFERLFVPDAAADRQATLRRYAEKKSILDSVLGEAKSLNRRLGKQDQKKLEEYLGSVRETEIRVERLEEWIDVPKPAVRSNDLQLGSQPGNAHDRPMWLDVMLELAYLSFVTDTTRVITFEWSREAGGFGGGGENHHELSHHGGDEGMLQKLAKIDRFHVGRLSRFLDLLKATQESDSHMLDRTIVLFGSGMNSGETGDHSPKNLPLIIAGGKKLGLKQGQHLAFDPENHPPLSQVLLTAVQAMNLEVDRFQDASSRLAGLV